MRFGAVESLYGHSPRMIYPSVEELEDADDMAALQEWRTLESLGQVTYAPVEAARRRLGLDA